MKFVYVSVARGARWLAKRTCILGLLDGWARRSRRALWVRSLLSIYDPADMLKFDVPWWTFRSADLVDQHLRALPRARVFEWGSGASTVWLCKRAHEVVSVEHDLAWAGAVRGMFPKNCDFRVVPTTEKEGAVRAPSQKPGYAGQDFTRYVEAIQDVPGAFDLIVIDGRARESCLLEAVHRLARGGIILFDNVDRQRYRTAIASSPVPLDVIWTRGLTPCLPYPTRTAIISVRQ